MRASQTITATIVTQDDDVFWPHSPAGYLSALVEGNDYVTLTDVVEGEVTQILPTPNRERLIDLALWAAGEQAKKDLGLPSEWRQEWWLTKNSVLGGCGTACCIAGKVAVEDGGKPAIYGDVETWAGYQDGGTASIVVFPDGTKREVEAYAVETLGLTSAQAARLFDYKNDLATVISEIKDILDLDVEVVEVVDEDYEDEDD